MAEEIFDELEDYVENGHGVRIAAEQPINEDCSSDAVPDDVTDLAGRKKVYVPVLNTITRVLFKRYRLSLYTFLNRELRNGGLAGILGCRIETKTINHTVCCFPKVTYWKISRDSFYADIAVELQLRTEYGLKKWNGFLVCVCGYDDEDFYCEVDTLTENTERKNSGMDMLSPFAVPYLTNRRVDEIAENMLYRYWPEALTNPQFRSARELASRMGLIIQFHPVFEHKQVRSILFFSEGELVVGADRYDQIPGVGKRHIKTKKSRTIIIPPKTIVINTNIVKRDHCDFEIFHECKHYDQDYLFFRLQGMESNDTRKVEVRELIVCKGEEVKDPIYFMEKQANRMAYGLMMPITHTRMLITDLCARECEYRHAGEKYEKVGLALAKILNLPHFRIRARMIQLGYVEAKGSLNYVQHQLIRPFAFDIDSWKDGLHTFVVEERTVRKLQETNEDLNMLIESGAYVYADGHVVRNDSRSVHDAEEEEEGKLVLTDWANAHVDECCLRFVRKYVQTGTGSYVYGRMYYDAELERQEAFYLSDIVNQQQLDQLDARMVFIDQFPRTFREAFEMLMEKNGDTQESLAADLNITSRTLRDWLKDPEHKITTDFVIMNSLRWKLPYWISKMLLDRAMIRLNEFDRRHRALDYIRTNLWDQGIETANQFLVGRGLEPLHI